MKKGLLGIIYVCLILLCFSGTAMADEQKDPSIEGEWIGDGEDWQYRLTDGEFLKKSWLYDKGKWYYFSNSGYMVYGSQKIEKKLYYFYETGEMATGWVYDEENEAWYYIEEDGVKKTGWHQAGGVWYWFDSKGAMYHEGFRMVSGHKYYFFENGQMAANQYIETYYYNEDGLRDKKHDIVIQGKRKLSEEEKQEITNAMEYIPGEWIKQFVNSGWEIMYYTDKEYFSAPRTEFGTYYVHYKTDVNYKKIKITKPEALTMAFGEYIANATGNDKEENQFMADLQQYLESSSLPQSLPSYFDDKQAMWFGLLFDCYIRPEGRQDIKRHSPQLAEFMEKTLGIDRRERKPTLEELYENLEEAEGAFGGDGPADDEDLKNIAGPSRDGGKEKSLS